MQNINVWTERKSAGKLFGSNDISEVERADITEVTCTKSNTISQPGRQNLQTYFSHFFVFLSI